MRGISLVVALSVTLAQHTLAQWPSRVTTGARVQVTLPEVQYQVGGKRGHPIRGRVSTLTPDTLYLAVTDSLGPLPVPRTMIQRLDYSRGVPSRPSSALRNGLISGIGLALFMVLVNDDDGTSDETAALVGGAVGLTVGGITGALFPRERWKRVRLQDIH